MESIKYLFAVIIIFIFLFVLHSNSMKKHTELNYVPDSTTAVKIAEAIWLPIYGDKIYKHKPFNPKLIKGNVWFVYGSLHNSMLGDVPNIKIQKSDCKILEVYHSK